MRILCISVHPVLEYDEIQLFEAMGHQVFSLGFYLQRTTATNLRPPLPETGWHRECFAVFEASGCRMVTEPAQWIVTPAFCALFDVIVVHHNRHFVAANWDVMRGRPVVWRTIGQEVHWAEDAMREYRERGVKIVRWSPEEQLIDRYIGADAIIRTSKRPSDWLGWTGETPRILTFNNNFRDRGPGMSFDFHQACVAGQPFDLFGLGNDDVPDWRGVVDPRRQIELLRGWRVAFVTGTNPAPYTLGFVEAWMTGIPVVHVGRQRFSGGAAGVYEIDRLIVNGENGFMVEDVAEAHAVFRDLLEDHVLCERISRHGRASAIAFFGRDRAKREWTDFFSAHV